jgi:hypothetical protein
MNRFAVALAVVLYGASSVAADSAPKPRGAPENAWRYVLFNGRWWYWTPDGEWALFDGRRWVTFLPKSIGSSLADRAGDTATAPHDKESRVSGSLEANARSILDSTRPQSPLGATLTSPVAPFGPGTRPNTPGVVVETAPSRSGDAGSGVGGGSVGGTSVTAGAAPLTPATVPSSPR